MQSGVTAKYRNLIRHIRNWPRHFTWRLQKEFEEVSFVTRGNPVRFRVPSQALYVVFRKIFVLDFYGIDALLKNSRRDLWFWISAPMRGILL